jgi:glycosyltransferase involved in cell wall biosynthesis
MRIAFFDWVCGGHHVLYLRRFIEAWQSRADAIVAAPDEVCEELSDYATEKIYLGLARPPVHEWRPFGAQRRRILEQEARLLERTARDSNAEFLVHLYADHVLPYLIRRPEFPVPVSVLLFYPRAHYPAAFGTRLPGKELFRARARELVVATWRRRADAHALLTLDEEAARWWAGRGGVPAYWIPEPPISTPVRGSQRAERSGCVLYGALAERKGIDLLARAIASEPTRVSITIAGEADASFLPTLRRNVAEMELQGAAVDVRAYRHSEAEGLQLLARAKCAVLPYPRHDGMSRVLMEACSVGTPVIVHDRGLVGHLVRTYKLGHAVDCRDARALRRAILDLALSEKNDGYDAGLGEFAARFSRERFREAALAPFSKAVVRSSQSEVGADGGGPGYS